MKVAIKFIVLVAFVIIMSAVMKAFEPVVSSSIAVQQAYDTVDSSAKISIYNDLKRYSYLIYPMFGLLLFWKELKFLVNKKSK